MYSVNKKNRKERKKKICLLTEFIQLLQGELGVLPGLIIGGFNLNNIRYAMANYYYTAPHVI